MRWRRLEASGNVTDRRGTGAKAGAAAGGIGIIALVFALLSGALGGGGGGFDDIGDLIGSVQTPDVAPQDQAPEFEGLDESEDFVRRVLGSTETVWTDAFAGADIVYRPAALVLFSDATTSGCGGANAAVGPHYCPTDSTVYIDLDFFDDLQRRFGAGSGDFAQAYVIAHEIGHHVQNELGIMGQVQSAQQSDRDNANELSVRLELQADCFAGVWAYSLFQRDGVLEDGDIEEALDAAAAVGDDRIQAATTGQVNPETWTHGSSAERVEWFTKGYRTGDPNACDTFS